MFTPNEVQIPCKVDATGFTDTVEVVLWKVRGSKMFYPTKIVAESTARQMGKTYSDIYFVRFYSE